MLPPKEMAFLPTKRAERRPPGPIPAAAATAGQPPKSWIFGDSALLTTLRYSAEAVGTRREFMAEERINRKLAAILAADVVGYSRLMVADEAGTLAALKRYRELVFDPTVAAHNGRIVKLIGDGTIVEFGSVVDAVNCALSVQRHNGVLPGEAFRPI
jgi:class 3 adenylate cyclase